MVINSLCVYLPTCLSIWPCADFPAAYESEKLPLDVASGLASCHCASPSVDLALCLCVYLFVCLFVYLFIYHYLSIYLFVQLSIHSIQSIHICLPIDVSNLFYPNQLLYIAIQLFWFYHGSIHPLYISHYFSLFLFWSKYSTASNHLFFYHSVMCLSVCLFSQIYPLFYL